MLAFREIQPESLSRLKRYSKNLTTLSTRCREKCTINAPSGAAKTVSDDMPAIELESDCERVVCASYM